MFESKDLEIGNWVKMKSEDPFGWYFSETLLIYLDANLWGLRIETVTIRRATIFVITLIMLISGASV